MYKLSACTALREKGFLSCRSSRSSKISVLSFFLPAAYARFSESIVEYLANLEKAPNKNIRKEDFAGEIYSAYEVMFTVWLQTKEPKVCNEHIVLVGFAITEKFE